MKIRHITVNLFQVILFECIRQSNIQLIPLARSWNNAPEISEIKRGFTKGYEKGERAYVIHALLLMAGIVKQQFQ
jgi:hypothetical protein